jgi:hypothetical protein
MLIRSGPYCEKELVEIARYYITLYHIRGCDFVKIPYKEKTHPEKVRYILFNLFLDQWVFIRVV